MPALRAPDWETDGLDWPNREASRFVEAGGLRWHVQVKGRGPVLLLLHGTGASTHSFRDLLPLLARDFQVVAPDLPGHGFTARPADPAGLSLPGMSAGIAALLGALALPPQIAVGHSAGAALLCQMQLTGQLRSKALVSLNGALLPLPGLRHPACQASGCRGFSRAAWSRRRRSTACSSARGRCSIRAAGSCMGGCRATRRTPGRRSR
jgi:magnesium chelatase accessory protein